MTDASPMTPAEDKDLAAERIIAAVQFARTLIESVWAGEIEDDQIAANIQATAESLKLCEVRPPTEAELADPDWWGYGHVGPDEMIESFDPVFATVLEHLDATAVEGVPS